MCLPFLAFDHGTQRERRGHEEVAATDGVDAGGSY